MEQILQVRVLKIPLAMERKNFKIGKRLQLPNHFNRTPVVIPEAHFLCFLKETQLARFETHHGRDDTVHGHSVVRSQDQPDLSEVRARGTVALHTDHSVDNEQVRHAEPEHVYEHFMKALCAALLSARRARSRSYS